MPVFLAVLSRKQEFWFLHKVSVSVLFNPYINIIICFIIGTIFLQVGPRLILDDFTDSLYASKSTIAFGVSTKKNAGRCNQLGEGVRQHCRPPIHNQKKNPKNSDCENSHRKSLQGGEGG